MRAKPYTERGIRRCKCTRCGDHPALYQWSACAAGNKWMPLCTRCDVELNRVAMTFVLGKKAKPMIAAYEKRVMG
jgi:hypothetical protein